jgi:hypothetical protein
MHTPKKNANVVSEMLAIQPSRYRGRLHQLRSDHSSGIRGHDDHGQPDGTVPDSDTIGREPGNVKGVPDIQLRLDEGDEGIITPFARGDGESEQGPFKDDETAEREKSGETAFTSIIADVCEDHDTDDGGKRADGGHGIGFEDGETEASDDERKVECCILAKDISREHTKSLSGNHSDERHHDMLP